MDPNLFHLDWERLAEVLMAIIVFAFFVERALSLVFENRVYIKYFNEKGLKAPIAFLLALVICRALHFDALSMIVLTAKTSLLGEVVTAAVIAGGSKASIKLFHDLMKVKSDAEKNRPKAVSAP